MRAAVFEDVRQIRYTEDYPRPVPEPDEALVKVHYCAVCGTDVKNWNDKIYQAPLVMGHEFAGEVVEVGAELEGFAVGEKVVGVNVALDTTQNPRGLGIFDDGGFAEYVAVPADFLFHVPDHIPFKNAAMIESFAVAVRAVNWARVQPGEPVVIIGGGNIGLTTLRVLRATDASASAPILVVEPHPFLREIAERLGATAAVKSSKVKVRKFIRAHGPVRLFFECAGVPQTLLMAIALIGKGGRIVLEGVQKGKVEVPVFMLNAKEIGLRGSLSHSRADVERAIQLMAAGALHEEDFLSVELPLAELQAAFERFVSGAPRDFVKQVVRVASGPDAAA